MAHSTISIPFCRCVCGCVCAHSIPCQLICQSHGTHFVFLPKHINELTMRLDLPTVICGAEAIYLQLAMCKVGSSAREKW